MCRRRIILATWCLKKLKKRKESASASYKKMAATSALSAASNQVDGQTFLMEPGDSSYPLDQVRT